MRLSLVAAAAVLAVSLTACADDPEPATPPSTPSEPTPTTPATPAGPQSSADLVLAPGGLLPLEVGMSRADAESTGVFAFDVEQEEVGCTIPIQFTEAFEGVDVLAGGDGTVVSFGVTSPDGPRTEDGLGVGSRFGELIETYGAELSAPEVAGFDQVGVFVQDGDEWLGFLFGDATSIAQVDNDPGVEVTFAEVTSGEKPQLIRSGC